MNTQLCNCVFGPVRCGRLIYWKQFWLIDHVMNRVEKFTALLERRLMIKYLAVTQKQER